jgi:hypothetical protein
VFACGILVSKEEYAGMMGRDGGAGEREGAAVREKILCTRHGFSEW